jgi:hypothetical protein
MTNEADTRAQAFDLPAVYEIRVRGIIGPEWSDWFDGLTITPGDDNETVLIGLVEDQPALNGILKKICELGFPLISVFRHSLV